MTTFFEGKLSSLAHYAMLGENREKWDAGKTRHPHFLVQIALILISFTYRIY